MQRFTNTFSIKFYCRKTKVNKKGLAPVEMGLNIQGERMFVGINRLANPKTYESDPELMTYCRCIEDRIRSFETDLLLEGKVLTKANVSEFIKAGYQRPDKNINWMFSSYLQILKKRVDNNTLSSGVYRKYELVSEMFVNFLHLDTKQSPNTITSRMISDFVEHIYNTYAGSSASGMLIKLKTFFIYAKDCGVLQVNPFMCKIKREIKDVVPLREAEIQRIRKKDFSSCERLERVRDLFIFSCGTGLAYIDAVSLTPEDFKTNERGQVYIQKHRAKTDVEFTVVVLPEALEIAKKYNFKLPKLTNQKTNSYLKEIGDMCHISQELHFHLARHSYASLLLNKYHFSLEVTAKCLGHTNIRQSAHYAKIFSSTVFDAFQKI